MRYACVFWPALVVMCCSLRYSRLWRSTTADLVHHLVADVNPCDEIELCIMVYHVHSNYLIIYTLQYSVNPKPVYLRSLHVS